MIETISQYAWVAFILRALVGPAYIHAYTGDTHEQRLRDINYRGIHCCLVLGALVIVWVYCLVVKP